MKLMLPLLLCSCLCAAAVTESNRFTAYVEGARLNGDVINPDGEVSVKDFGAVGNGIADDTAAIQAGINFCTASGKTLYFPAGTNLFTQLTIPTVTGQPNRSVTIRMRGPILPAQAMFIVSSGGTITGGAILKSTTIGTSGQSYFAAGSGTFNSVTVDMENLTFQTPPDATMIGLNLRDAYAIRLRGVRVWTAVAPFDITSAPTHNQSVAIATPANNNAAFTQLSHCDVSGYFTAYELSEHADIDYCSAWACIQGATFPGGYHSIYVGRLGIYHCQYGFGFTGAQRLKVDQLDFEHAASTWKASVADIYDPSGFARGEIEWSVITQNVGITHTLNVTGAPNLQLREIGTPYGGGSVTNVTNVTNVVTGSSALFAGSGTPSISPTNSVAVYINTNTSAVWYWFSGAWH
jgi:hypothetical protein